MNNNQSIRVLHLNTWGGIGGAFIAANRLHQGLLNAGIESVFAYRHIRYNSDSGINRAGYYRLDSGKYRHLEHLLNLLCQQVGLNDIGHISTLRLHHAAIVRQCSLLNFHNLHSNYFSYLALPKLTYAKSAAWTLHDMWSFTGHCVYSYDCDKWLNGCGKCPYPQSQPEIKRDATHIEWMLKRWTYQHADIHIIPVSRWLADLAAQSILKNFPIHYIPNGIDTQRFQPLDPEQCRHLLGIPKNRRVILYAAQMLFDRRKGGEVMMNIFHSLPSTLKKNIVLLTFGEGGELLNHSIDSQCYHLGYLNNDRLKMIAYSAADVFLFPTLADNLPLTVQESLACGTPVVSFHVGGVSELVHPNQTGYLAKVGDSKDLCAGMIQLLEDLKRAESMRQTCRALIEEEYTIEMQIQRYIALYQKILSRSS